jgi:hypothetical protein
LQISDPKDAAGQRAWERATPAAIELSRNPGEMAGAKLLAIVGQSSSLGDPRKPDFLKGLRPGQRAVALEQLAHAAASWHLQDGRNADGTRNAPIEGVVTMTAQAEAIISRPATKAATADALRLAATQAGPQRGELLAKAAIAEREAAEAAKAVAVATSRSEAAWLARAQRRIDAGRSRARARARAEARSKAAAATTRTAAPDDMLFKRAGGAR